jgi:signal peptidase I
MIWKGYSHQMREFFRDFVITLILAVVIFFALQFTVGNFVVIGASMQPSFYEGERVVASKLAYKLHEPERGDVIVFLPPGNMEDDLIKRIIGLPGEIVEVRDGVVYVDNTPLLEPYIKQTPNYTYSVEIVPENEYWVLGDNRNNSNDSHTGWTVPREDIIGKAWLIIWPPDQWQTVPDYFPVEE